METQSRLLAQQSAETKAAGHAVNWEAVYADQLPRVYNYFRFRTGDRLLAEDLTAATFEKAWRAREQYRDDLGAFSTWLFTVARSIAASHFRRASVRHLPLTDALGQTEGTSVADEVEHRDDLGRLHALLARLPDRDRELIELKYGAALTNRAIAKLLEMSESNVGTTLQRIVRRLGRDWDEDER
jgi:RNA polymerase sigma factor (sigma-70 family)